MDTLPITVMVLGRRFKLNVQRDREPIIREAANLINEKVKNYQQAVGYKDVQDLLTMVTLDVTSELLELENNNQYMNSKLSQKLDDIEDLLTTQDKE